MELEGRVLVKNIIQLITLDIELITNNGHKP